MLVLIDYRDIVTNLQQILKTILISQNLPRQPNKLLDTAEF